MAKKTVKEENWLLQKENGLCGLPVAKEKKIHTFCEGYKSFLNAAKTERECVREAVKLAEKAGFVPFQPGAAYAPGDRVYCVNREKAMILAVIGEEGCKNGVSLVASHIDSPRLDLKPVPLYEKNEMALLKTHYYGGIKKYQWTAIPLAMHGTVVCEDGRRVEVCVGEKDGDPQFCVTDLLPHLSQEQSAKTLGKAIEAENLNILFASSPSEDEKGENRYKRKVMQLLHDQYGICEEDLTSAELEFVPAFRAVDIGLDRSMIGAYGHDDRVCAYPALQALLHVKTPRRTAVAVLADKEEIGSVGNTGLDSQFLAYFIEDLAEAEGLHGRHVLSHSQCLSADVTSAFDPNYPSAYEINNACSINRGVGVMKYTGARGKSGSSEASAEFTAHVRHIFNQNGVQWQMGELGRVDLGGGGTVALYVAGLNVDVIDIGVPVLSMHAPFEVVSKYDVYMTYKACKAFFEEGKE